MPLDFPAGSQSFQEQQDHSERLVVAVEGVEAVVESAGVAVAGVVAVVVAEMAVVAGVAVVQTVGEVVSEAQEVEVPV